MFDYCVIGGGIVGLATARELNARFPSSSVLLIDKEEGFACHQTGHNSGVIHSGIYYKPGSLKATLCKSGADATRQFCREQGIPFETRGKLIVATTDRELERMRSLAETADRNGIEIEILDSSAISGREPSIIGKGAILVPSAGIVSYPAICEAMASLLREAGCEIALGATVEGVREERDRVVVETSSCNWVARRLVVCAGLQADRLAKLAGLEIDFRIVPFRGEYYDVVPAKRGLVRHMIYPVPDPEMPFLGIHLTPMIDGGLTVGPNSVLGFARERYAKYSVDTRDVLDYVGFSGFWRVIGRNWRAALTEAKNSLFKSVYLAECRKYCPSLEAHDLVPRSAGIRAQAVMRDGSLAQDFLFRRTARMLHVCNAPSPAATSAIPIARNIVAQLGSNSSNAESHYVH